VIRECQNTLQMQREAITGMKELIAGLVQVIRDSHDDSEGRYPCADSGCIDCTVGTVPDRLNTGRCAYHKAVMFLENSK